jgi:hypothetical protein
VLKQSVFLALSLLSTVPVLASQSDGDSYSGAHLPQPIKTMHMNNKKLFTGTKNYNTDTGRYQINAQWRQGTGI